MKHDPSGMAAAGIVLVGLVILGLLAFGIPARAESVTVDQAKNILRLQYSEFCAVVKKPPSALAEALNQSVAQDPKTWLPVIAWWNAICEKYKAAGCGDA
jgi:hypothetical protein